jgi:hypothetical protein
MLAFDLPELSQALRHDLIAVSTATSSVLLSDYLILYSFGITPASGRCESRTHDFLLVREVL